MMISQLYRDRYEAGKELAKHLTEYASQPDILVLGLPRGGVPVAYEIAKALHAPLNVFIVRKIGVPGHRELAMGAITSGSVVVYNEDVINQLDISKSAIEQVIEEETKELKHRESTYHHDYPLPSIQNKTIILVDDGIATGATMLAAMKGLKALSPAKLIVAAPVGSPDTIQKMRNHADQIICPLQPDQLYAIGNWYMNFDQTSDEEVLYLLNKAAGNDSI